MSLIANQITKSYPTRSDPLMVLKGINLQLSQGDALAVMGPSGSGKSTLLHILGTLDRPSTGSLSLNGTDPFQLSERGLASFRNERIGFVFQDHHLLPQCSVLENVLVPTFVNKTRTSQEYEDFAHHLLERVGLASRLNHRPAELSGGERQRVAVARALVLRPILVLADEPTGNLDRINAQAIGDLLLGLNREQNTILVVVTHSSELAKMFPLRSEMRDGYLIPV
jgi:lipoprotein-releasing system ATP-binding protein